MFIKKVFFWYCLEYVCDAGAKDDEISCCVCQTDQSEKPNEIVLCDNCGLGKCEEVCWICSLVMFQSTIITRWKILQIVYFMINRIQICIDLILVYSVQQTVFTIYQGNCIQFWAVWIQCTHVCSFLRVTWSTAVSASVFWMLCCRLSSGLSQP